MSNNPNSDSTGGLSEEASRIGSFLEEGFTSSPLGLRRTLFNFTGVMEDYDFFLEHISAHAKDPTVRAFAREMSDHEAGLHSTGGTSHKDLFNGMLKTIVKEGDVQEPSQDLLDLHQSLVDLVAGNPRRCLLAAYLLVKLHHDHMRGMLGACATSISFDVAAHPYFKAHACGDMEAKRMLESYIAESKAHGSFLSQKETQAVTRVIELILYNSFGIELSATATA